MNNTMTMATAEECKAKGNAALQAGKITEAIEHYTTAIRLDGANHVYFSNRSAAYLKNGDAHCALEDAISCIGLKPDFAKGYSRKGAALHTLKRYNNSIAAYEEGLAKFPEDAGLKKGLEDVKRDNGKNQLLVVAGKTTSGKLNDTLVWANLHFVDSIASLPGKVHTKPNPVVLMGMAAQAYYDLYPYKTPADLEREFRARGFDAGLIASSWRDDPSICHLVETGKVVVTRMNLRDHDECLDYHVKYSCRPRAFAEEELLKHAPSAEENLLRLETAGDLGAKNSLKSVLDKSDSKIDAGEEKVSEEDEEARQVVAETFSILESDEREFLDKVRKGSIRLEFQTVCMETAWREAQESHPNAEVTGIGMARTGELILALVAKGECVCPYARQGGELFPFSIKTQG